MAQYDLNIREYWWIFKKRKFVILGCAIVLGIFSTALAILKAPEPLYTSVCTIKFERETTVEGLYAKTISWSTADDILTQTSIIKSFAVFQKVAEKLGRIPGGTTDEDRNTKSKIIGIIENLQSKAEVKREEYTNILHIKVTDRNPDFAQKLANTIALTYKGFHAEQQMKRTTEAIKYISDRLKDVRERLKESEDEFNSFSQKNELISIDLQSENLIESAQKLKDRIRNLHEVKRELTRVLNRLSLFVDDPSGSDYDFYTTKASSQYKDTNETLIGLRIKKVTLLVDYTFMHPDVVAIDHQIFENARKMMSLLRLQIRDIDKEEKDFQEELEKVERTTGILLDKKLEFNKLKRNLELYTEMTGLLEQKHEEALIRKAEKPEEVAIVKPALLPAVPINPPQTMATGALGLLIGLVLGLVTAFVVETFDTSLGAIDDVEETLGLQVLGVIPQADIKVIRDALQENFPGEVQEHAAKEAINLISHFVPKSMLAENFRALRTNIQFKDVEKKIKTIAVVSTTPEEGKSLVALNLALTMAQTGMKILLVGCDLRKPTVARTLGVERSPGMTDILLGNYQWRDTVKSVTDIIMGKMTMDEIMLTPGMDNLHIISSGAIPPNPAELVDSTHMMDFIEEVKQEFDLVIFDSTPILSTADAAILGTKVDGVLLVYRVGIVSRGLLRRSTAQLQQINSHVMGVVLNGMRPEISLDFQDLKNYSYYYSYGNEGEEKKRRGREANLKFPRKKGDSNKEKGKKEIIKKERKPRKKGVKKRTMLKLSLMLMSLAFLTVGILWQNGYVDPLTWIDFARHVTQRRVKQTVKKEIPKQIIQKSAVPSSIEPKPGVPEVTPLIGDNTTGAPEETIVKETPQRAAPSVSLKAMAVRSAPVQKDKVSGAPEETIVKEMPPRAAPSVTPRPMSAKVMPMRKDRPSAVPVQTGAKGAPAAMTELDMAPQQRVAQEAAMPKGGVSGGPAEQAVRGAAVLAVSAFLEPKQDVEQHKALFETENSHDKPKSYPYSLYFGSFKTLERAKKAVSIYRKKGLSPYRVKVLLDGGFWYRVYAGHFEGAEQAENFRRENRLPETKVKKTPYANLIGTYTSTDELEDMISSLKDLGFFPYVIKDDGKSRLFVGAFLPVQRAERTCRELEAGGIRNRIVSR